MKRLAKSLIIMMLVVSLLMSSIAMIVSYAAIPDYPVELAFNNIFVFDKWANNSLSTTIVSGGVPVSDKLDINIENGSFRFTNQYSGEAYTGHGMGTGVNAEGNYQYYMMEVEPNAAYTFAYNVTCTTGFVTPYVFFFDGNNGYISLVAQPFSGSDDTEFVFLTPSNAHYIQIRFTIPTTGYADFKDIAIRKTEVDSYGSNIFDFDSWANNTKSNAVCDVPDLNYNGGTINASKTDKSVTLTTNSSIGASGVLFTNFTFGNGNGYYMMDVEPDTMYNFSYNIASCNFPANYYQPYVVYYKADGSYISYVNTESVGLGSNKFIFKTPADAEYIQIIYGIVGIVEAGKTCTIKDVAIQKISLAVDTSSDLPHRLVYTYSKNSTSTYGELPVPSYVPDGFVFAGWYTGINGTGELITENTAVHYSSYTVYPKYDPKADSLAISKSPVKTEYTVGERINPTGLELKVGVSGTEYTIDSGYYCTPEYMTAAGTQKVTVHYGGRTAEFTVKVSNSISKSVVINDSNVSVSVANNVYTITGTANTGNFNYYKLTYYSDAYVKGVMTYSDGATEEFFLEPSSNFDSGNAEFASYIDGYLEKVINAAGETTKVNTRTRSGIKSIAFTLLDNKSGTFDLLSIKTNSKADISGDPTKYLNNGKYKVGVDLLNGGVITSLYVLNSNIVARVYDTTDAYGNATTITKVDYANKLPGGYKSESTEVNLINYYDNGRELQQSYYGTGEKPYEQGYYNRADWNYNPVQAGNVINEASKVIDYEITDDYIYIKSRPLDWAKWSDDFANKSSSDAYDPKYGDDYVTDTYVEAKYIFEDGLIKAECRMVDYSGYPSAQTTQELPAFYTIEPLNHYVYNDVSEADAWKTQNLKYEKEPEFWGLAQEYIKTHYPNGFSPNKNTPEHWAAFMASNDSDSFGIGLYSPEVTNFYYGVYPQIYGETLNADGTYSQTNSLNYRHATTTNPAKEDDSSYIAPIGVRTFESYNPSEYSYYISTGTVEQIRNSFGVVDDEGFAEVLGRGKIVVPETIYMTPSTGESKTGQYYINNVLDKATNIVSLEAVNNNQNAYIQFNIPGAKGLKIAVNTVTSGVGDIILNEASNIQAGNLNNSYEGMELGSVIDADGYFSYKTAGLYINGTGLKAGKTAVAEWVFTVTMEDGSVRTYYAYSTLYAPNYHSVGATAEARYNTSNRVDGAGWISGVHSVSTSIAPFGKNSGVDGQGAFKSEPLLNLSKPMTPQDWGSANNLTSSSDGLIYAREYYRNSSAGSNEQSPTGILYVDYSRNKNTNTIPNVYVGAELLKADAGTNDSNHLYSFYTLGTGSEFKNPDDNGTPSGWTQYVKLTNTGGSYNATVASTLSSGTNLSSFYSIVRDANSGRSLRLYTAPDITIKESGTQYIYTHTQIRKNGSYYANMYSAVQIFTVNKSALRTLVLEATSLNAANYTADSWNAYLTQLRTASANLGNPSASSVIDTAALVNARNALQTKVTLNANGGNFSGANTNVINVTVGTAASMNYDLSAYTPVRSGYTFVGWSTDANATEGTNPVTAGLMPTLYAVWEESGYNVAYDANGGSGFINIQTVKLSETFALASYGFTRPGYTLVGWSTSASATTATYGLGQSVSALTTNSGSTVILYAVWTENAVNAVDDTVVVEYGLPVEINVLKNDVSAQDVTAIGTYAEKTGESKNTTRAFTGTSLELENGNVVLANGKITYTPTTTNTTAQEFYYEVTANGAYYYAKVTVIPATSVYYEDTFFKFADATITKDDETFNYNWTTVGEVFDAFQSSELDEAYGYDSAYDNNVAYSGGAAHVTTVDKNVTAAVGPTATFTFTGTGFDLFTVTDYYSGMVTATVYSGAQVNAANRVQGLMANAYFGYEYNAETEEYEPADNGAIYQVPIIKARDLDYGTYTVVVAPRYNKSFDITNAGNCKVYVDSVRIYDPMGDDSQIADEVYMADGEYAPEYLNIRDTIVQANNEGIFESLGIGSSVYLDGGNADIENYLKNGPKNEVYLGKGNSVAFNIVTKSNIVPTTIQLGMRLTGINGTTADVKLTNGNSAQWLRDITLNSTTERYYSIDNAVDWTMLDDGTYKTAAPIIITNNSDAIISLTSLKWAFDGTGAQTELLYLMSDGDTPEVALMAIGRAVETEIYETILNPDNISISFSENEYTVGDSAVLTISTLEGVACVTVNGTDAVNSGTDENGKMLWTYEFSADAAGEMTFEIVASDENGLTSESISVSTEIKDEETTTETPDVEEPDGGEESDEIEDTSDDNCWFKKIISFIRNSFNDIINIIKMVINFVMGGVTV